MRTRIPLIVFMLVAVVGVLFANGLPSQVWANEVHWRAGLARIDITPQEAVRLSGYGNRATVHEGVQTPIHARCLAIQAAASEVEVSTSDESPRRDVHLLFTVDSIGLPAVISNKLASELSEKYGITRAQIVFSATHTHCAPHLVAGLSNLFSQPLSEAEQAASKRYETLLTTSILQAAEQALANMEPAKIFFESGTVGFAANRRLLNAGRWTSIGVQPDAPVDHSVPVLRIEDMEGTIRGLMFNYACHCTTIGINFINGDWAGYATTALEQKYPNCVAMCTIGCGADSNPNPRGTVELSQLHGMAMADEVARVAELEGRQLTSPVDSHFDFVAASFDLPTIEELRSRLESQAPQTRLHAERMVETYEREGRLPATYPIPIQAWKFGDQLTMVFIGGEVVVDYALRLKRELADAQLWVTSYANDVMGYVCSERMRAEGGYEYDSSGIYYALPGPWASGTEDLLIERIKQLVAGQSRAVGLSPADALRSMKVTNGYEISLVAAEPLVVDPINIAFDARGRMWVVEMGDYPLADPQSAGGRIKILTDTDRDGQYDQATVFLEGLEYPTGVFPWKSGAIVSAAPEIFFADDTDDDGVADQRTTWIEGFAVANPQHRVNGFSYGLDHSLHFATGDSCNEITVIPSAEKIATAGGDLRLSLVDGTVSVVAGSTQFIRSRNAWGEWFGSDNSHPMFHYPLERETLVRNKAVVLREPLVQLFEPATAPPVFPRTDGEQRLNDLFAANRFTSACSAIVADDIFLGEQVGQDNGQAIFVCEPVHNLVHRSRLVPLGATYRAERFPEEKTSELLASSDPWFRPVRAICGPDGGLYVVDMYRETIEHPEWIPQAWQSSLDLRAGSQQGRIYRVAKAGNKSEPMPDLTVLEVDQLAQQLVSPSMTRRDLAQQHLCLRANEWDEVAAQMRQLLQNDPSDYGRIHALWTLEVIGRLAVEDLLVAARYDDLPTLMTVFQLSETRIADSDALLELAIQYVEHTDDRLRMRAILALGRTSNPRAANALGRVIDADSLDRWLAGAILCSAPRHVEQLLSPAVRRLMRASGVPDSGTIDLLQGIVKTAVQQQVDLVAVFNPLLDAEKTSAATQMRLMLALQGAGADQSLEQLQQQHEALTALARKTSMDVAADLEERCLAVEFLGRTVASDQEIDGLLVGLIEPSTPRRLQEIALEALARIGDQKLAVQLVQRWPRMSVQTRDKCAQQMLTRRAWQEVLVAGLEQQQIKPTDLTPAVRQQLRFSGSRSLQVRAERAMGAGVDVDRRRLVDRYLQAMSPHGDRQRGAVIYKQHCAVCHQSTPQGEMVGPSLSNLSDRSQRHLVQSILDPNGALEPKYQSIVVQTTDGRVLTGVVASEDQGVLTFVAADAKRTTIARNEIDELKNLGVSLMPTGFEEQITPEMMSDLVQYLADGQADAAATNPLP